MRAEEWAERKLEIEGWPVNLVSYKLGDRYYCQADNVSPGANIARASAENREQAEQRVLEKATERLGRTRRVKI